MLKCNKKVTAVNYGTCTDNNMKTNLTNELTKIIDRLKVRVEKEVHDKGYFRNFAENFDKNYKPEFFGKNVALFVQRDEKNDGKAFLGIDVLHPTMNKHMYTYVMNGDRNAILNYINNENFIKEFEETVLDLSESLKND